MQRLQAEKDRIEAEVSKLKIEFEAFRIHSNKLLTQERDLNAKLRNNVFVGWCYPLQLLVIIIIIFVV